MTTTFNLLRDPNLQQIAERAVRHCRLENAHLGSVAIEKSLDGAIPWVPSFRIGSVSKGVRAYEISRTLKPDALLSCLPDLRAQRYPIWVGLIIPDEVSHLEGSQKDIERLAKEGVSLLTYDQSTHEFQPRLNCPPVGQHIPAGEWKSGIVALPARFRGAFISCHTTYQTSVVQGVQGIGQIVEATVNASVDKAIADGHLTAGARNKSLAEKIDALWEKYPTHRAKLGAARSFAARYRNPSSHPPANSEGSVKRILQAKTAMNEAVATVIELLEFLGTQGLTQRSVHLP